MEQSFSGSLNVETYPREEEQACQRASQGQSTGSRSKYNQGFPGLVVFCPRFDKIQL
jgi:hypothetical protein